MFLLKGYCYYIIKVIVIIKRLLIVKFWVIDGLLMKSFDGLLMRMILFIFNIIHFHANKTPRCTYEDTNSLVQLIIFITKEKNLLKMFNQLERRKQVELPYNKTPNV